MQEDNNGLHRKHPEARRDRRGQRGLWIPASVASVLLHVVILLGITFEMQVEPRLPSAPSRIIHIAPAMQAYDLIEVAGDPAPVEVQILERAPLRPEPVRPVTPVTPAPGEAAGERAAAEPVDPRSVRDRLRYHLTTPQVWRPPNEDILGHGPTPQQVVEQRIASQLGEYNDSVAAEDAARERATNWTVADADGGRWGVSPEGIHLGSITIPLGNSQFAVAPGRREEFAGRVRTWNELQDQAVREEARDVFKDRVKAIEARMDRERAARGAATAPVTPAARADTTGTGGPTGN